MARTNFDEGLRRLALVVFVVWEAIALAGLSWHLLAWYRNPFREYWRGLPANFAETILPWLIATLLGPMFSMLAAGSYEGSESQNGRQKSQRNAKNGCYR